MSFPQQNQMISHNWLVNYLIWIGYNLLNVIFSYTPHHLLKVDNLKLDRLVKNVGVSSIFISLLLIGNPLSASEEVKFNSQACQDEFVYTILYKLLNKQDSGYYLEIGAGDPISINNTYVLEKNYGWMGMSIDILEPLSLQWNRLRKNPLLISDATQLDYSTLLRKFPKVIDYLSLDIDTQYDTVLKKVISSNHIFKVITIEHDAYRYGTIYRNKEREILTACGYHLLCGDISKNRCAFEDWWVHPDFIPPILLQQLKSLDLHHKDASEVIRNLKTFISIP